MSKKFLLLVLFFLTGCSTQELELIEPIPPDAVITLEVSPANLGCELCREYKVFVFADGLVIFEGIDFVEKTEVIRFKISPEKVRELLSTFQESGFFKLQNAYAIGDPDCINPLMHGSQVIISIQREGTVKTVGHYSGCPNLEGRQEAKILWNLREQIEVITGIEKWIGPYVQFNRNETRSRLKNQSRSIP